MIFRACGWSCGCCWTQGGRCSAHGTGGLPGYPRGARSRLRRLLVLLGLVPYVRCAATALRRGVGGMTGDRKQLDRWT